MEFDYIENRINSNFFGLKYLDQIKIFDLYLSVFDEKKFKRLRKEFEENFNRYISYIKTVMKFKDDLKGLNSNELEKLSIDAKKILMEKTKSVNHSESNEQLLKKYLYVKKISFDNEEIQKYIELFSELEVENKFKIISQFIDLYSDIDNSYLFSLVNTCAMDSEFDDDMKELLDDLYSEYKKLASNEKISYIYYLELWYVDSLILSRDRTVLNSSETKENVREVIRTKKSRYNNGCNNRFVKKRYR